MRPYAAAGAPIPHGHAAELQLAAEQAQSALVGGQGRQRAC